MVNPIEYILDIFFPKRCIICSKTQEAGSKMCLCPVCHENMFLTFHNPRLPYQRYFDKYAFCLPYIDNIKNSVLNLKFRNQYTLAFTFGCIMAEKLENEDISDIDMVVPVPISKRRKKDRGYNQTELITKQMCSITGLEMHGETLEKIKEIPPLSSMNKTDRINAVKGAYKVCGDVRGKVILLTDDVYTTGSTVNECARILKKNGAKEVRILTLSAGVSREEAKIYTDIIREKSPKRFFDLF